MHAAPTKKGEVVIPLGEDPVIFYLKRISARLDGFYDAHPVSHGGKHTLPSLASAKIIHVHNHDSPFAYNQLRWQNVHLDSGERRTLVDVIEHGRLQIVEIHGDNKNLGVEVSCYGLNGTPLVLWDFHDDFESLLTLGYGLSPGDVKHLPGGISPDPHGTPNPMHPYLTRFKDTTEEDAIGNSGEFYSMAYTPAYPVEYQTRFTVKIVNLSNTGGLIRDLVVNRSTYVDLPSPVSL